MSSLDLSIFRFPPWADINRFFRTQLPVLEEICAAFDEGNELVLLEAPPGQGKSLLGVLTKQYLDERGLYLCSSLTLQSQFVNDFPDAEKIQGRGNYLPLDVQADPDAERWGGSPTCEDCDKHKGFCDRCQKEHFICTYCTGSCSATRDCPYSEAKFRAGVADLACSNTSYFITECRQGTRSMFSGHPFVILDEADCLEGEIMSRVKVSISAGMTKLLGIDPPKFKTKESAWQDWFEYAIPAISKKLRVLPNATMKQRRLHKSISHLLQNMNAVARDIEGWVFSGYDRDRIEFLPIKVDKIAPGVFWDHGKRFLGMSATLISPEEFVQSLGYLGSYRFVSAPSLFDVARRPIYFYPGARMVGKQEVAQVEAWPQMTTTLHTILDRYPDRNVLVHTHSGGLTKHLADTLPTNGRPVFWYPAKAREKREQAIKDFDTTPGSVLLAPSLERGFDGKDDRVRAVVLCKVPFPYLGDKQVSARLFSPGGKLWFSVATIRSIAQMVGRGMRHEDDYADCWILDSEFARFYDQWKRRHVEAGESPHLLFPKWFTDALEWDSEARFEVRRELKRRSVGNVTPVG